MLQSLSATALSSPRLIQSGERMYSSNCALSPTLPGSWFNAAVQHAPTRPQKFMPASGAAR